MNDDQLRRLLSDAVSDVEPEDRLDQIRASVHPDPQVVPMSRTRSRRYAVVGVAAAVAVIGGVAYGAGALQRDNRAGDPATPVHPGPSSHHTSSPTTSPTSPQTTPPPVSSGTKAYAVYYVGADPSGKPVLFREFHSGSAGTSTTDLGLAGLGALPLDPDYSTSWHAGDLTGVQDRSDAQGHGYLRVFLGSASLETRPAGMSRARAKAAIQQAVYTVQAALQKRAPVSFEFDSLPVHHLLGVPLSGPVAAGPVLTTLSLVNISSPNENAKVSGHLTVTGVNNSFEGTSVVYLERNGKKYLTTPVLGGQGGNKLYPWSTTLDLSKIPPAEYTLVAQNDDPSGQGHPDIDTRTIQVK